MKTTDENWFSGEVLREFRRQHKLTQEDLAKLLEIGRTYLAKLETGAQVPSLQLQKNIKETLERYAADARTQFAIRDRNSVHDHAYGARARSRDVPVVSWAAAGAATDYQDLATQIDETVGTHVSDPNAFAVILEGNSMEPEFKAGDRVVVAPNLEARNGDVVLAKLRDGRVMFKRFFRVGRDGKTIQLRSDNKDYSDLDFAGEQVRFIYPAMEFKRLMRR